MTSGLGIGSAEIYVVAAMRWAPTVTASSAANTTPAPLRPPVERLTWDGGIVPIVPLGIVILPSAVASAQHHTCAVARAPAQIPADRLRGE